MLTYNFETGRLVESLTEGVFADRGYRFGIRAHRKEGESVFETPRIGQAVLGDAGEVEVTGIFESLGIQIRQVLRPEHSGLVETLTIQNITDTPVLIDQIEAGFLADLGSRPGWRLCAIPFRVQLDGSVHDYPSQALRDGQFHNPVFIDTTREYMPPLTENGLLRSEAWAWGNEQGGIVVIKYNSEEIELSAARPLRSGDETWLQFGGAGLSLFGEPGGARQLGPGQSFSFGITRILPYQGGIGAAYRIYRDSLDAMGHTFPADYNPPVNWNELYDIGWYHSRSEDLHKFYTREALLQEAEKASQIGCELLYLDPGWEVCEGTTLWDESRLGSVKSLVEQLRDQYGLGLGYRTILRTYQDHWPLELRVRHEDGSNAPVPFGEQLLWEVCLCNQAFWEEKLRRILEISRNGVRFIMVDEFDWRGPCLDPSHQHVHPTRALDHVMAVYRLCSAVRQACPDLTIECHDPVWPWSTSIYVPTYFKQGFGGLGSYDENWGFEYMWDCLNDLKSGRATALYYYNLGCNVPLYLHITMAADNDACVFFWWTASTVRHLGIGGKTSSKTIEPPEGLPERNSEVRFEAYKQQMALYRSLKPYFARGEFHGIAENAHLHTLAGQRGGVLVVFNLTDNSQDLEFFIPADLLGAEAELQVNGAQAEWQMGARSGPSDARRGPAAGVTIRLELAGMSPAVIQIGDALRL